LVDGQQLLAELLPALEFCDLLLGFAQSGGSGKTLIHGLPVHFAAQAELRIMSRIVGLGTVASGLSAAAQARGDGTGSKIAQTEELLQ
jgi:hypothetical protein